VARARDAPRRWIVLVEGPACDGAGYLAGIGVGDRRVVISNLAGDTTEIRCPGRVVEGVRWSRDGDALLLLCRRSGATSDVFELWLRRLNPPAAPTAVRVATGLGWDGYFDQQTGVAPSLSTLVAWSRALP